MKLVCSVFDIKANLWSTPFFSHSAIVATRDFAAAARSGSGIAQFPEDYELWHIGNWDDVGGDITPINPVYLARGTDFTKEA